jgi:hypothetical protein
MRIAVIADTHGKLPDSVVGQLAAADEIWHLGDFCDLATLDRVRAIGPTFVGVLGNNDWGLELPERLLIERCGRSFLLVHILPRRIGGADFLLHGHTHVPCDQLINTTRVLNPGTIGKPNKGAPPAWAWMEIAPNGAVTWVPVAVR